MSKNDEKHALYLARDGESPKLFHADDVEAAKADGWKEPEVAKSNGAKWNAEDDLDGQTAAAEFAKQREKADAEKAEKAEAERQKAEAEKPEPQPTADLRVEVVQPAAPKAASTKSTSSKK